MTISFEDSEPSYRRQKRNWLFRYLGVQEKYDSLIDTALRDAADDAEESIRARLGDERIGSQIRSYQLRQARTAARDSVRNLFSRLYGTIKAGHQDAALAAVEAGFMDDARFLRRLFPNAQRRALYEDSMRQSATRGVEAMLTRIVISHKPLSKQVYQTRALANGSVDRIINSALAKGDSAADLAKAVASSIKPDTPGGVAYAAKRLGRTEINNAFHAQSVGQNEDKPWVDRMSWNLSGSHPYSAAWLAGSRDLGIEYCERMSLSTYGKSQVPSKHPNCLCFCAPKMMDWTTFEQRLLLGQYNRYIDENL